MKKVFLGVLIGCGLVSARATVFHYEVSLNGPSESPANTSPGVGQGTVAYDNVAHTLQVQLVFSGLTGNTTASHIHAPTAFPFTLTNTAGVATTVPTFAGFPLGVKSGTYSNTLDLTSLSSYNPAFVSANGGTAATAEAALTAAIGAGKAYWNVHSTVFPGGEIRGFLVAHDAPPVIDSLEATPSVLSPPNRKMVPVTVSADVSDDFVVVSTEIVSVTSNEHSSPGVRGPDFVITGPLSASLRADRLGTGNGRVYTITVQSEDDGGNTTMGHVTVTVPKGGGGDED